MKCREKLPISSKKFHSKLVYNKTSKSWKKLLYKAFYIPVILIDSVYRKDVNYHPKVFLEKYNFNYNMEYSDAENSNSYKFISRKSKQIDQQSSRNLGELFKRNLRNFCFSGFASSLLK